MEDKIVNPNQRQVGGDHYRAGYQHWDLVADAGMGYFEGQITKYLSRCRKKGGPEDVRKAIHYLDKLIMLYKEDRLPPRPEPPLVWRAALEKFFENGGRELGAEERVIFVGLILYRKSEELHYARRCVTALGKELFKMEELDLRK